MVMNRSILVVAVMLTAVQACPYLDRAPDRHPDQNVRRAAFTLPSPNQPPSGLDEAIQMATTQITQIITNVEGMEAKFVRLSFHDCVGGCDGCVDLSNPSNFGLHVPIEALDPVVQNVAAFLTIGDVWALAGLVAARVSQKSTYAQFPLQFVGRPQCEGGVASKNAGPSRELPSAHLTTKKVVEFFRNTFGFSANETVAILGAHSLGKAVPENSGFGGEQGWDHNPDILTNAYYDELLNFKQFSFVLEENPSSSPFPNQFYWEQLDNEDSAIFMLQADMSLAFDMEGFLNPSNGNVTCRLVKTNGYPVCPTSPLRARAQLYRSNNSLWIRDFETAFLKIVNSGCGNGICRSLSHGATALSDKGHCKVNPAGFSDCKTKEKGKAWCSLSRVNCQNGCGGYWCTSVM